MARGVNEHFLHLVLADRDTYRNWTVLAVVLACALLAPAYFLYPWLGVAGHAIAAVVGVAVGVGIAAGIVKRREASLAVDWNGWMATSVGKESIGATWRALRGRHSRNHIIWASMLGATFWTLQVILVLLALSAPTAWQAFPFIAVNGISVGLMLGSLIRLRAWLKQFAASIEEMVAEGEIGVWGVR